MRGSTAINHTRRLEVKPVQLQEIDEHCKLETENGLFDIHVTQDEDTVQVWLNTGYSEDDDGLIVGLGKTRPAALEDAKATLLKLAVALEELKGNVHPW